MIAPPRPCPGFRCGRELSSLFPSRSLHTARRRSMTVHLLKLCVGADCVEDLVEWQAKRMEQARAEGKPPLPVHVTRMWPKREAELLDGGSLYWVFKGLVL